MPIFVRAHMRAGTSVKAYRRSNSPLKKANNLVYALSSITNSGRFLNKPQKKAIYKARTIAAHYGREASINNLYNQRMTRSQRRLEIKRINSYHKRQAAKR